MVVEREKNQPERRRNRPKPPGERQLIAAIRVRAGQGRHKNGILTLGIGDDCAVLRPRRGEELVVTTDLSRRRALAIAAWRAA